MSSLVRRIQKERNGMGSKLGVESSTYPWQERHCKGRIPRCMRRSAKSVRWAQQRAAKRAAA